MKGEWKYLQPKMSEQLAPFIPIIVKNPLREEKVQVQALIDTGYDGFIAVSLEQFLTIGLDEYEIPKEQRAQVETYGGEMLEVRSASGEILIPDLDISIISDVDAIENAYEVLVGRKFLEFYLTTLNGPESVIKLQLTEY